MLPLKISDYIQRNSHTQIDFTIANTKELLTLLEDGKIDFAIVEGYFQKSGYEYRTISNEKSVMIADFDVYHEFNYIWRKNSAFFEYYQTMFSSFFDADKEIKR